MRVSVNQSLYISRDVHPKSLNISVIYISSWWPRTVLKHIIGILRALPRIVDDSAYSVYIYIYIYIYIYNLTLGSKNAIAKSCEPKRKSVKWV